MASPTDGKAVVLAEAPRASDSSLPIVVDMGKKPGKQVKQLREGRGKLMGEVSEILDELRASGTLTGAAQPVVIVVRPRKKTRSIVWPIG